MAQALETSTLNSDERDIVLQALSTQLDEFTTLMAKYEGNLYIYNALVEVGNDFSNLGRRLATEAGVAVPTGEIPFDDDAERNADSRK